MKVCADWSIWKLQRELSDTNDYITARKNGLAGRQVGLTNAVRYAEELRAAIEAKGDRNAE
ncbi:hypothetical protein [Sulfitobacter pacificus]|uniref:hypothetical protein n=1 Tax=Sulfitobacter pacificus TaxID=1499314 RepID=UPI003101EEEC